MPKLPSFKRRAQAADKFAAAHLERKAAELNRIGMREQNPCDYRNDPQDDIKKLTCPQVVSDENQWCPGCLAMRPAYQRYTKAVQKRSAALRQLLKMCQQEMPAYVAPSKPERPLGGEHASEL